MAKRTFRVEFLVDGHKIRMKGFPTKQERDKAKADYLRAYQLYLDDWWHQPQADPNKYRTFEAYPLDRPRGNDAKHYAETWRPLRGPLDRAGRPVPK